MKRVCVFCGSKAGANPAYADAARAMGAVMAGRGLELVYGGGKVGLMGMIADAVLAAGGCVTGVIPDFLVARELAHPNLTVLQIVRSMHERKARMADLADGFIALPGGFGTFEEFCEALTWAQLGLHAKPHGLLNIAGYYDPLVRLFDQSVAEGFLDMSNRQLVIESADPAMLLDQMQAWKRDQAAAPPTEATILQKF